MIGKMYLGPLSDLQEIEPPDAVSRPAERIQSVVQGATGNRTANTTGIKRRWELGWEHASEKMRTRLESIHYGIVPGPVRLVDFVSTNLFPPRVASGGASLGPELPFYSTTAVQTLVAPTGLTLVTPTPRLVTQLVSGASATVSYSGRPGQMVPARLGPVTFSFVVKSNVNGASISILSVSAESSWTVLQTDTQAFAAGSGWQTVTKTVTPPVGALGLVVQVSAPANSTVLFGPAQAELGTVKTPWVPGVGAPTVLIDTLGDEVPFMPYSNYSLVLLEA